MTIVERTKIPKGYMYCFRYIIKCEVMQTLGLGGSFARDTACGEVEFNLSD